MPASPRSFAGFEPRELPTSRGTVNAVVGGSGPPLLRGYPESLLMWQATALRLAEHHTVVAADLAGYGRSLRPRPTADLGAHSKRIACPWAARGGLPRFYDDVLDVWRPWAADLRGVGIDAGHFLAEDNPEDTVHQLLAFLS